MELIKILFDRNLTDHERTKVSTFISSPGFVPFHNGAFWNQGHGLEKTPAGGTFGTLGDDVVSLQSGQLLRHGEADELIDGDTIHFRREFEAAMEEIG